MNIMNFFENFFHGSAEISKKIDINELQLLVEAIKKIKNKKGRIFFLGVGGSAGNCSHAVNDFRKLCSIEAYTPLDNVSELTARKNVEGGESSLKKWVERSRLKSNDPLFSLSVGSKEKKKKYKCKFN